MEISIELLLSYLVFAFFVGHSTTFLGDLARFELINPLLYFFHMIANVFGIIFLFTWGYYVSWVDMVILVVSSIIIKFFSLAIIGRAFDEDTFEFDKKLVKVSYNIHLIGYFIAIPAILAYAIPVLYKTPLFQ